MSLLVVENLQLRFAGADRAAVDGVSLALEAGASLGIVGESGSGKSQTAYAILGLSPPGARLDGSIRFDGRELLGPGRVACERLRGAEIAMVAQDPMSSLNPHLTIGRQMAEVLEVHRGSDRRAAMAESRRLLDETNWPVAQIAAAVGIPDAKYYSRLFRRAYNESPQTWRGRERGVTP